jgi:hypothetical protein
LKKEAENLERRNIPKRWPPDDRDGKQLLKYSGWVRKKSLTNGII